jgi:oligoribonuclease
MQGIFLDIETNGLNPFKHSPIDIAFKVIDLSTGKELGAYRSLIRITREMWDKNDPISLEVNGFSWEEVSLGKDREVVGKEIISVLCRLGIQRANSVFICQNPSFDRSFFNQLVDVYVQELLNWPYHWLDLASMYWTMRLQQAKLVGEPLSEKLAFSKNEIAKYLNLPLESEPHRSMGGVNHLILCYQAVVDNFPR